MENTGHIFFDIWFKILYFFLLWCRKAILYEIKHNLRSDLSNKIVDEI